MTITHNDKILLSFPSKQSSCLLIMCRQNGCVRESSWAAGGPMLKAAIILCSICTAAGGTALWVNSEAGPKQAPSPASTMTSFQELHANAHLENLPVLK